METAERDRVVAADSTGADRRHNSEHPDALQRLIDLQKQLLQDESLLSPWLTAKKRRTKLAGR